MKYFLTKLLLTLSLVANPVAVFASDFQSVDMTFIQVMEETECDPKENQEGINHLTQHDDENCEMPCCEDSACSMQGICLVQHSSYFLMQTALRFSHPIEHHGHDAISTVVPERRLSPENPPPIHF